MTCTPHGDAVGSRTWHIPLQSVFIDATWSLRPSRRTWRPATPRLRAPGARAT